MNNKLYQKACNNKLGNLYEDIGEMTKQEFQKRKENAKFMNPDTFMVEHSLNSIEV